MALINPEFLDAVVMLGGKIEGDNPRDHWSGTAFFWNDRRADSKAYETYLVTNRHVLRGLMRDGIQAMSIRMNRDC